MIKSNNWSRSILVFLFNQKMGEADRLEWIQRKQSVADVAEQMYRQLYRNEHLVPLIHKFFARTDVNEQQ